MTHKIARNINQNIKETSHSSRKIDGMIGILSINFRCLSTVIYRLVG